MARIFCQIENNRRWRKNLQKPDIKFDFYLLYSKLATVNKKEFTGTSSKIDGTIPLS
jgi:hypothetical protein